MRNNIYSRTETNISSEIKFIHFVFSANMSSSSSIFDALVKCFSFLHSFVNFAISFVLFKFFLWSSEMIFSCWTAKKGGTQRGFQLNWRIIIHFFFFCLILWDNYFTLTLKFIGLLSKRVFTSTASVATSHHQRKTAFTYGFGFSSHRIQFII